MVLAALSLCAVVVPRIVAAQDTLLAVSRQQAVQSALTRGAQLAIARADTAIAFAQLLSARALQNPTINAEFTKSPPQYHLLLDVPLDYPSLRRRRIQSAQVGRLAAMYRYRFSRAAVALDADTTYTRTLAALAHARLSRRNAQDADSLRRMAVSRRDAGDASDLDVELATVSAGQQENIAAADSLTVLATLLDLQTVMGLITDAVVVVPTDSLMAPDADTIPAISGSGAPLSIAAAAAAFESAAIAARLQRRSMWMAPSVTAGFETHDPGGAETGVLPVVGLALPLPLLDRNRGPIAQANAERDRARAELLLAEVEGRAQVARARRELSLSLAKVERDQRLIVSANRVAAMSLTAYREGASSLPNVLEAQRNAREVLGQYVDDVAAAAIAAATLRTLTLTPATSARP